MVDAVNRDAAFWEERYRTGQTPWDLPTHARQLEEALERLGLEPGRALDLGCGRGRNSRYLAQQGFSVTGVDVSSLAIADAQADAGELDCRFLVVDLLEGPLPPGPYDLVFDFGCWHSFDDPLNRAHVAAQVAGALEPGGLWFAVIGCTDGPPREVGPPRRSARDVVDAVEPHFEILSLVRDELHPDEAPVRPTWLLLARRR